MSTFDRGNTENQDGGLLSPRQARFVEALLSGHTLTDASKLVGISPKTAQRYVRSRPVRDLLETTQQFSLQELGRLLAANDRTAIRTLAALMEDASVPPSVRRAAANDHLQRRLHVADLIDLASRWREVEAAVYETGKR